VIVAFPLVTLLGGVLRGNVPWLVTAVPLSTVPVFAMAPELAGARVYGFPAFLLSSLVFVAYLLAALGMRRPETAGLDRPCFARCGVGRRCPPGAVRRVPGRASLVAWWTAFDRA